MASLKQLQYRHRQSLDRIKKGEEQIQDLEAKITSSTPKDKNHERHLQKLNKLKEKLIEDQKAEIEYAKKVKKVDTSSSPEMSTPTYSSTSGESQPDLLEKMESLTLQVATSLKGVEQLVQNQNSIREQLQREQELGTEIDKKLKALDALTEKNSVKLNSLQEHLDLQKRLNDRLLIVESQMRDRQNKFRKLEQLVKETPTYQELRKIEATLAAVKIDLDEKCSPPQSQQEETEEQVTPPESVETPYGETTPDNSNVSSVYVDPILAEDSSLNVAWPTEMSDYLNEWVEARPYGWDHHQWNQLLSGLAQEGFSEFTEVQFHGPIGKYIETQRLQ